MSSASVVTGADVSSKPKSPVAAVSRDHRNLGLYALFFLSGFPALLYQVVWQRALFTIYGVNIESVTMVVSAFMLGLGLGSLGGGWLSERRGGTAAGGVRHRGVRYRAVRSRLAGNLPQRRAIYGGDVGPGNGRHHICPAVGAHGADGQHIADPDGTSGAHIRQRGPVGGGLLYFVNTLGSATACFCAVVFLMDRFGESGSVILAAAINAVVGLTVLLLHVTLPKTAANAVPAVPPAGEQRAIPPAAPTLAFHVAVWVAGSPDWYRWRTRSFGTALFRWLAWDVLPGSPC